MSSNNRPTRSQQREEARAKAKAMREQHKKSERRKGFIVKASIGLAVVAAAAIIASVVLAMVAFSAQVVVTAVEDLVYRYIPTAQMVSGYFAWGRIIPFITLFVAIYVIFAGLTPSKYRSSAFPKWPGPALVSMWWLGLTALLPVFLSSVSNYDLTYGSLAGVMVALIFFYLIGLGLVTGAQLNAALANAHENGLRQFKANIADE